MLKIGLLGRGSISYAHTKAYEKIENAKIVACCDIRPEQLDDIKDARKYTDIDTFLAEEAGKLDYVDICLPTYLHAEVSIKAMRAGFNVLCEKPMAINSKKAEEMMQVSEETGKRLMIAHCSRFIGATRIMKEEILKGEMGKVRNAEYFRQGGSRDPMGYKNWFRDETLSGGALLDLQIHDIDVIRGLMGMPNEVCVVGANVIPSGNGYDEASSLLIYDNMHVFVKVDWAIEKNLYDFRVTRINFDNGYMFLDRTNNRTTFTKVDQNGNVTDLTDKIDTDMYYNEIVYYIDCLVNNKPFDLCPVNESIDAVRIVEAQKRSADLRGEKVKV
ncbi:MAG: Gfo/Idh/MocA family oxidoreductase [Ruminococcaceae bacterium]|nr:Gfo/Idh/MocA family oxidoreductase [Oscillospiraceae bacterium]